MAATPSPPGTSGRGHSSLGHACLAYDDRAALEAAAHDFLAAGRAAGQQVRYLADEAPRGWDFEPELMRPAEHYPVGGVIDPATGLARWAAATEAALAAGYTGLCVAADTTALVRTPEQLDAYVRYEHRVDRYVRANPFTAMCALDRRVLGDAVVADVACVHPHSDTPFRLFASGPGSTGAALAGELDAATRTRLEHALDRAELDPAGGELVLDAPGLTFVDHNTLLDLDAYARRRGTTVLLRTRLRSAARLADLLDLTALRVEITR
ncbi:MEDS domain-containing protein [Actinoplanes sp. N902-109]|uniref:MEDS domain-containing protein n=1 Tax=Actinoplanes sp. (strain N902-109) TaxID=649831 RepID=UPI0003294D6B|nr:MEDS domain-containing protein [Actinoplanes sp. N902-109]AGL17853.1 hypothetical protein L083_4343 [Actinoplanes sp. N902-109]